MRCLDACPSLVSIVAFSLLCTRAPASPFALELKLVKPLENALFEGHAVQCEVGLKFEKSLLPAGWSLRNEYQYLCFTANGTKWRCVGLQAEYIELRLPAGKHRIQAELIPRPISNQSSTTRQCMSAEAPCSESEIVQSASSWVTVAPKPSNAMHFAHYTPQLDLRIEFPRPAARLTGPFLQVRVACPGVVLPRDGAVCVMADRSFGEWNCFRSGILFLQGLAPGEHHLRVALFGTGEGDDGQGPQLASSAVSFTVLDEEQLEREIWDPYAYWLWNSNVWRHTTFLGMAVLKYPTDLWNYQELIMARKPRLIVETGTAHGGSALFLAYHQRLAHSWPHPPLHPQAEAAMQGYPGYRTISIDIGRPPAENAQVLAGLPHLELLTKSSVSEAAVSRVRGLRDSYCPAVSAAAAGVGVDSGNRGCMFVLLDSAHSKAHVLRELRLFVPLLLKGDYLVVEDTNVNGHPVDFGHGPGPWEAVQQFLVEQPGVLVLDKARERKFGITAAPGAYFEKAL